MHTIASSMLVLFQRPSLIKVWLCTKKLSKLLPPCCKLGSALCGLTADYAHLVTSDPAEQC